MPERMPEMKCPRCGGSYEPGFLLDRAHMPRSEAGVWVEGEPEQGLFSGVKTGGRTMLKVTAERCTECGHLELSATAPAPEPRRCPACGNRLSANQTSCPVCGRNAELTGGPEG